MRHTGDVASVALIVLLLTGCVAAPASTNATGTTPSPTVHAVIDGGCELVTTDKQGILSGPILDGGERPGASGSAIVDADGSITGYQVVEGDAISAIADRFCMEPKKIYYRNSKWYPTSYPTITPGAMLLAPDF